MPAIPIITAAAGVYSVVSGADAARKASNAAQDQARAAAGVSGQQQTDDAALQAYFDSDPAFAAEYNRNRTASRGTDNRSPLQWLADGLRSNPTQAQEFANFKTTQLTGANSVIPGSVAGPGGTVDLNLAQQAAQGIAQQNAATSAALENQYNPGASELRQTSLQSVIDELNAPKAPLPTGPATNAANEQLLAQIAAQAGQPLTQGGFDSPLTRAAAAQAQADLALGGILPQDVRNLVARNAFARSGAVSGGLGLGRDITARDLGLTSLDLRNRRLAAAASIGSQEAALEQANAAQRMAAEQFGRTNLLQSQQATAANAAQQAQDYFNLQNLLQNIQSGDFARSLAAAQLGQNIAQPQSGLSPGSVVDLAVGNVNLASNAQQQANAIAAQTANQKTQAGGQILGAVLPSVIGGLTDYFKPKPTTYGTYTPPTSNYISGIIPGFA